MIPNALSSMFKGHLCFAPCLNDTIKL